MVWVNAVLRQLQVRLARLRVDGSQLSAAERQALADYEKRHCVLQARGLINALRVMMVMALLPPMVWLPPPHQQYALLLTHLIELVLLVSWLFLQRFPKLDPRYYFILVEAVAICGYSESIHQGFLDGPESLGVTYGCVIYAVMTISSLAFNSASNLSIVALGLLHLVCGTFAWRDQTLAKELEWFTLLSFVTGFSLAVFYLNTLRRRRDMLSELETRDLLLKNERSRLASVELDLQTASEMQDSFAPSASVTKTNGFVVQCYQSRYGLLGGDWSAVRTLPDGTSLVIVADATGKGVQAALVVQVVQALWTGTLRETNFDPLAWLHEVNRTLFALGGRRHHTMSLGMLVLQGGNLIYYSAGHLPLFLLCRRHDQSLEVVPLLARGSLLGLNDELRMPPVSIAQNQVMIESIVLGTDGVFDRGLRTRKQAVLNLVASLAAKGVRALDDCPAADDKLLVLVKRADAVMVDTPKIRERKIV